MKLAIEIIKREIAQRELANKNNHLRKDEITKELESLQKVVNFISSNPMLAAGWIPVKEQLPELMEFVLVHNTEGAILVARLFTEDWVALFSDGENKMGELTPTHWMPLPPPPACS